MDNTINDVPQGSSPVVPADANTPTLSAIEPEVSVATTTVGAKTPSENLYAALAEERKLRKQAEEELNTLKTSIPTEPVQFFGDEEAVKKLSELEAEVKRLHDEREMEKIFAQYPDLKGLSAEFDLYRQDFPRHKLENVAKLFLTEKGLIEVAPARKGLEQPTGGNKEPQPTGISASEVENLRKNNYKKYMELVRSGKLHEIK